MANDGLFIGWGPVVRGREQKALLVFQETLDYWRSAQGGGRIESFEPILLEPHGGGLAGFMLVRGPRAALDEIRASDEFQRLMARASAVVEELGIVSAFGDGALGRQLGLFQEAASALG